MKKLNCLVIEDEPLAAEIVRSYIEQVPFLKFEAVCGDAITALDVLKEKQIDVIFLDMHLPKLKGIDFLKILSSPPKIIVTSAHKQYAIDGYEHEISDYLLKPFSFARFFTAVSRLNKNWPEQPAAIEPAHKLFNVNKKKVKIYLKDILYVESLKDYVKIFTAEKTIVTKFQLGELEKFLDDNSFIRVHRSFIVARNKIDSFSYDELEVGGTRIPIGRSFSSSVKKELEKN